MNLKFNLLIIKVPANVNDQDNTCSLIVTENSVTATSTFAYRSALTPSVSSSSPIRGGTGGGTVLTINGNNFP
jgi:hypothetical protein